VIAGDFLYLFSHILIVYALRQMFMSHRKHGERRNDFPFVKSSPIKQQKMPDSLENLAFFLR
jgi:hypothetical protein